MSRPHLPTLVPPGIALLLATVLATGCSMPCSKVLEDVDDRYARMEADLRRDQDPGGDRYDLAVVVPGRLVDASFQRLLDTGAIDKTHKTTVALPLPQITGGMDIKLRADLKEASFLPSADGVVRAHTVVRLRGNAHRELFDVTAEVDGPVELFTRNRKGSSPALFVRIGDLQQSEIELDGAVMGQAVRTELEGLIPGGAIGDLLGSIGVGDQAVHQLEDAFERGVREQIVPLVQDLLSDKIGDVKVMEMGAIDMGGIELTPTAVGVITGDGWIAVGLRTDLATGPGQLDLAAPDGPKIGKIHVSVSQAFLERSIQLAYLEGLIPRTFDDQGQPSADGPYHVEPLGIELGDTPRVGVRVSRCDDPCGWAELWADMTLQGGDRDDLGVEVGDIEVAQAKGSGKLVELVLWHQEKVVGQPVEFVQQVSRVLQPDVAGEPLTLKIKRVKTQDGVLELHLGYQLAQTPAGREEGKKSGESSGRTGTKKH